MIARRSNEVEVKIDVTLKKCIYFVHTVRPACLYSRKLSAIAECPCHEVKTSLVLDIV